jgi:hypothetical protein
MASTSKARGDGDVTKHRSVLLGAGKRPPIAVHAETGGQVHLQNCLGHCLTVEMEYEVPFFPGSADDSNVAVACCQWQHQSASHSVAGINGPGEAVWHAQVTAVSSGLTGPDGSKPVPLRMLLADGGTNRIVGPAPSRAPVPHAIAAILHPDIGYEQRRRRELLQLGVCEAQAACAALLLNSVLTPPPPPLAAIAVVPPGPPVPLTAPPRV